MLFPSNGLRIPILGREGMAMLVNRNITVGTLRTSVRLEPEFWTALTDIAAREKVTVDQLCTVIDGHLGDMGRTAGIRVFVTSYFAATSTDTRPAQVQTAFSGASACRTGEQHSQRAFG